MRATGRQARAAGMRGPVLVFLLTEQEEHAQLPPEVGARDGVEEEVDAVVDVEDGSGDEGHAPEVVEVGGTREGGQADVLGGEEELEPRGEVRDVEGHKAEGDGEEDEGELQSDDALFRHHADLQVWEILIYIRLGSARVRYHLMFTCDLQDWDSENAREKTNKQKKRRNRTGQRKQNYKQMDMTRKQSQIP